MPDHSRRIVIHGVSYRSMTHASRSLGWSMNKIYYYIGEKWRCSYKRKEA